MHYIATKSCLNIAREPISPLPLNEIDSIIRKNIFILFISCGYLLLKYGPNQICREQNGVHDLIILAKFTLLPYLIGWSIERDKPDFLLNIERHALSAPSYVVITL